MSKNIQHYHSTKSKLAHNITSALHKACLTALLASAASTVVAHEINCNEPPSTKGLAALEERHVECLQDPGWFDVGAGVAVIPKINTQGQSGTGNLVTLRAYPFGRWYAPLKSVTQASAANTLEKLFKQKEKMTWLN